MTLARRMTIAAGIWVAVVLLVAAGGLWAVASLRAKVDASLAEYEAMRRGYEVGIHAWRARDALGEPHDAEAALGQTLAARAALPDADAPRLDEGFAAWRGALDDAAAALSAGSIDQADAALTRVIGAVAARASTARRRINDIQQEAEAQRQTVTVALAVLAAGAAVVVVLISVAQHRAVMRPLRRLAAGVRHVAQGRFDQRLETRGDRELSELAADFNTMADQLQTLVEDLESRVRTQSAQLARSERLASVGHLAAGVAHEINNPLGIIAAHAELALRDAPPGSDTREALAVIRDEAFRGKAITDRLLGLSRGVVQAEPVELLPLAQQVLQQAKALPAAAERVLTVEGEPVTVQNDASLIRQVLLNLVLNALEATEAGGRVTVSVHRREAGEGGEASITVRDDGRGLGEDELARVFEPFYTTRRGAGGSAGGTGLGLSISHAIAEQLGGRLEARSAGLGRGSLFEFVVRRL